jgi:ubiquinone/menaquinone biosynthesis C-methylase UbiE
VVRAERGLGMEGPMAHSYAKLTNKYLPEFRELAGEVAAAMPAAGTVLEVAPGPGFLAIELAHRGFQVTGLDISKTFVEIARRNAREMNVRVHFDWGNAAEMPFDDESFDFVICRAAFKNFADPVAALREMKRVLKPGGTALVIDLRRDASLAAILSEAYPKERFSFFDRLSGRLIFPMLRRRAYTAREMKSLMLQAGITAPRIDARSIGFEARFER